MINPVGVVNVCVMHDSSKAQLELYEMPGDRGEAMLHALGLIKIKDQGGQIKLLTAT